MPENAFFLTGTFLHLPPKFYGQYILSEWNALPKGPFSNFASNIKRVN